MPKNISILSTLHYSSTESKCRDQRGCYWLHWPVECDYLHLQFYADRKQWNTTQQKVTGAGMIQIIESKHWIGIKILK